MPSQRPQQLTFVSLVEREKSHSMENSLSAFPSNSSDEVSHVKGDQALNSSRNSSMVFVSVDFEANNNINAKRTTTPRPSNARSKKSSRHTCVMTDHEKYAPFLLESHTAAQLALHGVPVRSRASVNPYDRAMENPFRGIATIPCSYSTPVRNVKRKVKSEIALLSKGGTQKRSASAGGAHTASGGLFPLMTLTSNDPSESERAANHDIVLSAQISSMSLRSSEANSRSAIRKLAPIQVPFGGQYQVYHQLQCKLCQNQNKEFIVGCMQHLFAEEQTDRSERVGASEAAHRAECYKWMMAERKAMKTRQQKESELRGNADRRLKLLTVTPSPSLLPQLDHLMMDEMHQRMALARKLWRRFRSLHFAFDVSSTHDIPASEIRTELFERRASAIDHRLEEMSVVRSELLATVAMHIEADQRVLLAEEFHKRFLIMDEFNTSSAALMIHAVDGKANAAKFLAQRRSAEQQNERRLFVEGPGGVLAHRAQLKALEAEGFNDIAALFHDGIRKIKSDHCHMKIVGLIAKEEVTRRDKQHVFLEDLAALVFPITTGEEQAARKEVERGDLSERHVIGETKQQWLATVGDKELEECRLYMGESIAKDTVEHASHTFAEE